MHWYYEDYDDGVGNGTTAVDGFLDFIHQTRLGPVKKFRTPMPLYRFTQFTVEERQRIWQFVDALSTTLTWSLLGRYHEDHRAEDH